MATAVLSLLVLCLLYQYTEAQTACSMPTPFSNGNEWLMSQGTKLYINSATQGIIDASGTNYTVICDGQISNAGTLDYYGRIQAVIGATTVFLPFCFQLETGTANVMGFKYRTAIQNILTVGQLNAQQPSFLPTPATNAACDVTGTPAEYENTIVDYTGGALTPITCPTVLRQTFNAFQVVNGTGVQCAGVGGIVNTSASTTSLTIHRTNCTLVANHFASAMASISAHCLRTFTDGNGVTFVIVTTSLTSGGAFHCMAYSDDGTNILLSTASRTFSGGICDNNQTSTWSSDMWFKLSYGSSSASCVQQTLGLIIASFFSFFIL